MIGTFMLKETPFWIIESLLNLYNYLFNKGAKWRIVPDTDSFGNSRQQQRYFLTLVTHTIFITSPILNFFKLKHSNM